MCRPALEVADIFRDHGPAWRQANAGHVSLGQMRVMSAIERCRTAALGGHVGRCENETCAHTVIAYNSCRNRHCPKCQGAAARQWLVERLLALPARAKEPETPEAALEQPRALPRPCPCCGSRMIIIETFARGCEPKYRPTPPAAIRIDTS